MADSPQYANAFSTKLEITNEIKHIIEESIISNTDVFITEHEEEGDYSYEPRGQEIEVALVKFLIDNDKDIHSEIVNRNKNSPKLCQLPFDQNLKRKSVIRQIPGDPENVRVYVKGAPEYIFQLSTETLDDHFQKMDFPEHKKDDILDNAISYYMAATGLKVISYAFKDMPLKKLNEMMHSYSLESAEFRSEIESDLIYLCTFGLQDPLRENIDETIQLIRYGNTHGDHSSKASTVNIKMVTGDHIETARWVGIQSGLITEQDAKEDGVVVTGEEFMNSIGPFERVWNDIGQCYEI